MLQVIIRFHSLPPKVLSFDEASSCLDFCLRKQYGMRDHLPLRWLEWSVVPEMCSANLSLAREDPPL